MDADCVIRLFFHSKRRDGAPTIGGLPGPGETAGQPLDNSADSANAML